MEWLPVSERTKRLRAAVQVRTLEALVPGVARNDPAATIIQEHLSRAQAAARDRSVNEGWGHLHEAERLAVGLADADELEATVVDLRREATDSNKFRPWRRKAILEHLAEGSGHPVKACDVQHALRLRSEHFDNVYSKIDETLFWIVAASLALVILLATLLGGVAYGLIPLGQNTAGLMGTAILMGALGGALSTGLSLTQSDPKQAIPDLLLEGTVTAFRPILGGATAAVTFVFIQAGLLDFMGTQSSENPWLVASIGFLAGFSERWFIGIVDSITEGKAAKNDHGKGP